MTRKSEQLSGRSAPLGVSLVKGGANFSIYSRSATGIDLLLFERVDDGMPARVIHFDPVIDRTYHYWHHFVSDIKPGQIYGYRAQGPFEPAAGLRFDSQKLLLDPYG